tara:strand:- start:627 stop:860 length:234 start_codon:yes stop_codon:yes gene_type:complete
MNLSKKEYHRIKATETTARIKQNKKNLIAKNKEANLVYKNNYELMFGNYSPKDVSYHTKLNPMSYRQQGATLNGKVL